MRMMDLEKNIIDNILECQVKLGMADLPVSFYYPQASLIELLVCNNETLNLELEKFKKKECNSLGRLEIEELKNERGRYVITVPAEGVRWVNANFAPSEFMQAFIAEIKCPGITLGDLINIFKKFSDKVNVNQVGDNEWALSFENLEVDPYVYHIEKNCFGLEYHRFTHKAYELLNEGAEKDGIH